MFPLSDDRPRMAVTPVVTWSIIGACFLVFLWESSLGAEAGEIALYHYGMIPARLLGLAKFRSHVAIPASATVLTSMFLHGGWLHLGLNMLFLWVFGGKVEELYGPLPILGLLRPLCRLITPSRRCAARESGVSKINRRALPMQPCVLRASI